MERTLATSVLTHTEEGVRLITLNRPEERNSLNNEATERLAGELRAADADPNVFVVVLTGAGEWFCSGLDRVEVTSETYKYALFVDEKHSPWKVLFGMDTPVIAAVNGPALNSGLGLALMCSFMIASTDAEFSENYATIQHTHPMGGLISQLALALGVRRAREFSFLSQELSAMEAYERGLVNHVVSATELLPFTLERARLLAEKSDPRTVALMNNLYREALTHNLKDSYAAEEQGFKARELNVANVRKRYRDRIWAPGAGNTTVLQKWAQGMQERP